MSLEDLRATLTSQAPYREFVTRVVEVPARAARPGTLSRPLPGALAQFLEERGITLAHHQCQTIELLRAGQHVLLNTPPASGKTLAFNVPVWERLMAEDRATALYLYPTKALAQDQWAKLSDWDTLPGSPVTAAVYDGDTPQHLRARIRRESRLVLTNFYMLHQVLPWSHQWERFWRHLAFVVIDEAHVYRGVFGSNVSQVVRRLRRLLDGYGASPQFVLASATIANPHEFSARLTGVEPLVVDQDGSARGRQHVIFYNPEAVRGELTSPHQETARILALGVEANVQTMAFAGSRRVAELVARWARELVAEHSKALAARVSPYRAGYLPKERRALEQQLLGGHIRGMVSTNALEVGIDVGGLEAVVVSGFPGTMISWRQQAGRAGRGAGDSLVVWIPLADPLDQYLARHPEQFFGGPAGPPQYEPATVDLDNPYILSGHLLCATAERPLADEEAVRYFGRTAAALLAELGARGLVRSTQRGWVYQSHPTPTSVVSLDALGIQPTVKVLQDGQRLLETLAWTRALVEAHPGAVLLHGADTYVVSDLDLAQYVATVERQPVDYWTDAQKVVDIRILQEQRAVEVSGVRIAWGDVEVTERVVAYKTRRYDEVLAHTPLDLPPVTYRTRSLWFSLPEEFSRAVRRSGGNLPGGLHGAEHALVGLLPLFVLCDRRDLGGLSVWHHPDTGRATIFVHERAEGGVGLTEQGFSSAARITAATLQLVRDCPCDIGCPSCVYSPTCSNDNLPMDKAGAQAVLEALARAAEDTAP